MSDNSPLKPLAIALGAVFTGALAAGAQATDNPFAQTELSGGYQVAQMAEGKCGGMKSGAEGRCGMKVLDANGDGKITKEEFTQHHDTMFGKMDTNADGVIDAGEHAKMMESMGGGKPPMEGKCGAGMMGK
ncbi:MAG: hypothetical protein HY941_11020 [Gammaproteobacteria bacterium]|nr:hypothetical protein [Gammaproteobacteria bacterium]